MSRLSSAFVRNGEAASIARRGNRLARRSRFLVALAGDQPMWRSHIATQRCVRSRASLEDGTPRVARLIPGPLTRRGWLGAALTAARAAHWPSQVQQRQSRGPPAHHPPGGATLATG